MKGKPTTRGTMYTHQNHYIFSDHYLNVVLPANDVWKTTDTRKVFEELNELYHKTKKLLPGSNEAQTEEVFIRPTLKLLNHIFDVQPPVGTAFGTRRPDFAFFTDKKAIVKARKDKGKKAYFRNALGIGDAKYWDRPLDKKLSVSDDPFENNNPSFQIDTYLRCTEMRWGILTNGRLWRLYNRDTSYRLDTYYQVDLVKLLEQGNLEAFKYFYLFFRREALLPICEERKTFLDIVYSQSIDYAKRVGAELKENVYNSLKTLGNGFLVKSDNKLHPDNDLESIRANSLILLYRLLFIFYAEARNLLPMENTSYRNTYSLESIKKDIRYKINKGETFAPDAPLYWDKLKTLFKLINNGSTSLEVPAYNGGLFKPKNYPFLEHYSIGDNILVMVIDNLSCSQSEDGSSRVFVDYRDLNIRDLGTIYEGLLEYQLKHAYDDLAVTTENKYVPLRKVKSVSRGEIVKKGELYLETDKGERKATGSYYTPEYIVNYIVENTLSPSMDKVVSEIEKKCRQLERKINSSKGSQRKKYQKERDYILTSFDDEVLKLKVLDPAMGSGHFLVRATDFLAEQIATNPYSYEESAPEDETAIDYWKRRVVEHCIYGVDLNPLAVELAKLSLWLKTVAKGKPLSFLDHHLRCGHSLIGAQIKDLVVLPEVRTKRSKTTSKVKQIEFETSDFTADMSLSVKDTLLIEELPSDNIKDIDKKSTIFARIELIRNDKYCRIANLWTSVYFGNELSIPIYRDTVSLLQGKSAGLTPKKYIESHLRIASSISSQRHFFHWELEFPEVFFDKLGNRLENPGFDVVLGNPPWGAKFDIKEKAYCRQTFHEIVVRMINSYMYCVKASLDITRRDGLLGLIVPNPFLTQIDAWRLRKLLLERAQIRYLVNLCDGVFGPELANPSCMFIVQKTRKRTNEKVRVADVRGIAPALKEHIVSRGDLSYFSVKQEFYEKTHNYSFISKGFGNEELIARLARNSVPLIAHIKGKIQRGISADYAPAFIVNEDLAKKNKLERVVLRPVITGHNVAKFFLGYHNESIIYLTRDDKIDLYPNIKKYLKEFESNITCPEVREGKHPWYALHRPRDVDLFESPKLVGLTTSDRLILSIDNNNYYAMDNLYMIHLKDAALIHYYYLLSILNSSLLTFVYQHYAQEEGRILPQVKAENLYPLPVPLIAFVTPETLKERKLKTGKELYYKGQHQHLADLLKLVLECMERVHSPDPRLVKQHNAEDINKDWQIPNGALWEQTDVVHGILSFLVEQLMETSKKKLDEMKGFIEWLERHCKAKIDELKKKRIIRNYHEQTYQVILDILKDNDCKLGVKINRKFEEELKSEFEKSVAKLEPLKENARNVNKLIDQIVYMLFRLTEEEIKIVEKSVGM